MACGSVAFASAFGGAAGDEVPLWLRAADHWLKAPTEELLAKTDSPAGSWNLRQGIPSK